MVVDIGGGSTELIGSDQRVSLDIGSVRLTERHLPSDPPTETELEACAAAVRSVLPDGPRPERAIGVAGTITSLAALDLGLAEYDSERVHGHRLTLDGSSSSCPGSPPCRWPSDARCRRSIPIARR